MPESIGARLKRLRTERGLSQRAIAGKGVSYAYVSRIEADARQPSVKAIRLLAAKLGVTPEELEFGTATRVVEGSLFSRPGLPQRFYVMQEGENGHVAIDEVIDGAFEPVNETEGGVREYGRVRITVRRLD
jgi:transcriptional regulator with XRE-family HTH domain